MSEAVGPPKSHTNAWTIEHSKLLCGWAGRAGRSVHFGGEPISKIDWSAAGPGGGGRSPPREGGSTLLAFAGLLAAAADGPAASPPSAAAASGVAAAGRLATILWAPIVLAKTRLANE